MIVALDACLARWTVTQTHLVAAVCVLIGSVSFLGCDAHAQDADETLSSATEDVFADGAKRDVAPPAPKTIEVDLGGGVTLSLVRIPEGSFLRGSDGDLADALEAPVHKVTITEFYLGKYEVTQEQWEAVVGRAGGRNPSEVRGKNLPVDSVSWLDVGHFLRLLEEKFPTMAFGLPTEAEWEYACRAGSQSEYFFGGDGSRLREYANVDGDFDRAGNYAIGTKRPNAWGLYDMMGNVSEWCYDWFGPYKGLVLTNPFNPGRPEDGYGQVHVIRGSSRLDVDLIRHRSSARSWAPQLTRSSTVGFRAAAVKKPGTTADHTETPAAL
jgi:formylglycine-generating enzyme required for sulfatase activity